MWLSAARGLTRAQRREALAVLSGRSEGEASKAAIELGVDEARRSSALRARGGGFARYGAGSAARPDKGCGRTFNALSGTPLSGLHHPLAVVRGVAGEGGDGEGLGGALRRGGEHGVRWRHRFPGDKRFGGAQGDRGSGRDLRPRSAANARAGAQGTASGKAKKRGLSREQVPVLMAADRSGTDGQRGAAQGRCGGARGCPRSGGREGRPICWSPTTARATHLAPSQLGVSHEALNRSMGERVRGDLHCRR